mgnify:CR=1 FL=1
MQDGLIDEQAFSFESDEAEAQFYESVEREIEQPLAEGLPPLRKTRQNAGFRRPSHDDLPFCRSRFLPHQTPATTRLPQNNE